MKFFKKKKPCFICDTRGKSLLAFTDYRKLLVFGSAARGPLVTKYHYHLDCLERVCNYPDAYSLGAKSLTAAIVEELKKEKQKIMEVEEKIGVAKKDFEYLKP